MSNNPQWLPELESTIPKSAYGRDINTYSVALEAWRRGLEITFNDVYHNQLQKHSLRYDISDGEKSVTFMFNRLPIPSATSKIISSKSRIRKFLAQKNISVAKELTFKTTKPDHIKNKIKNFNYPIKISALNKKGKIEEIYTVSNDEELTKVINKDQAYDRLVVGEYYPGEHYYAYVVGDEMVGAYKKMPAFITGDGKNTISSLIEKTNNILDKIPTEIDLKIKLNEDVKDTLSSQNYSFDSVPDAGEIVTISEDEKFAFPVDATNDLPGTMKESLVNIIKEIPIIRQGEVEFVYDKDTEEYRVYAVNGKRGFRNYLYPMAGAASPIPKAIIDLHFPKTKNKYLSDDTPKFYFDYDIVSDFVHNGRLTKAVIPKHRYEPNMVSKKITFSSDSGLSRIRNMMKSYFSQLMIDGEFNAFKDNRFELLIIGNYMDIAYFYDQLKENDKFTDIKYDDYKLGIKQGYSFNDYRKDNKILKLEQEIETLKNKLK